LEEKIKIKPLTKQQIIISLDRLTRFKPTEEKYLRVFKDIIISNLISPKFKRSRLDLTDYDELRELAENIFNFSLIDLNISLSGNYAINKKLLEYEKSVFKFDKNVQKLLENKIDYFAALCLIDNVGVAIPPCNLRWLKSLSEGGDQRRNRANFRLKFPLEKIILAEGITEEILLPKFARLFGRDFDKDGIHLISAGGKNQVVKLFYKFADILKLPIFVLLDSDAKGNFEEIQPKLRPDDKVYVLKRGEFEDTLPLCLIKKTLNKHFEFPPVSLSELRKNLPMTQILEEVFKQRGLEFKKAEFAALLSKNILTSKDISPEIEEIILSV